MQISGMVTVQLISTFVLLHRNYNPSTSYIQNFKPHAIFGGCTAQFVSDVVGNLEDWFSCDAPQMFLESKLGQNLPAEAPLYEPRHEKTGF